MPRTLLIDPDALRAQDSPEFVPIPVNRYSTALEDERERYGDTQLIATFRAMAIIREVETMLGAIKRGESYEGFTCNYLGPAHLSIGQEAVAAGQALALGLDDHTFGGHRSHGELVARGMAAVDRWAEEDLAELINLLGGSMFERRYADELREEARGLFLYGLIAEIFGRSTGFNRGVGGSMHAFMPALGIFPNNAIVGGSAPIAAGAALYKRVQHQPGVTVANIGDGSSSSGPVWEAMNFSAMRQFHTLWDEEHNGGLPVIFFFVNNFYAMGGQPIGETMGYETLARIGAAVNPESMHAEVVDGSNPLAVADAVLRAKEKISAGEGPVLIDCQCYRFSGHSPSDAGSYRTREEVGLWQERDPLPRFRSQLVDAGILTEVEVNRIEAEARALTLAATKEAADESISPRLSVEEIKALTFSGRSDDASGATPGETLVALTDLPRWQQLQEKDRTQIQMREALFEAIADRAVRDNRLTIYGEENRDWGGAFGVYRGLTELLPYHRLFNSPISEAAIIGTAVGYAMEGGRAIVEFMYADFMGRAGDELFNQLAKWHAMSGGTLPLPVVVRASVGSAYGAQHSQDWSSLPAHIPGLRVVYPATPYDAKGLMTAALESDDPVIFFESQRLYGLAGEVPAGRIHIPIGEPKIVREGSDATVLTIGPTLHRTLAAADALAVEGLSVEVIDARTIVPLNLDPIVASVERTGRLLVASDATQQGSFTNTIATEVQRRAFDHLDAPVVVVGSPDCITPPAELEADYFPSAERIAEIIRGELLRR